MGALQTQGRTKARGLTLVNWRGVFFMSYALDGAVTAFEGSNGAGKTTVMIAAYVVMLPDMTRLRFTNLGETGALGGDRGIWGRLGEGGRPSYAALDLELNDGSRMVAVVQLEKKSEPTVEPTPFVIHGLSWEVKLSELLLERKGELEGVPELDVIRAQVSAHGGRMRVFQTAKEYFAELFDRGVLPLRMQLDEERNKFNEMLRTSMIGGISRALTGGMREFLLREETNLGEVLRRMRGNLEACRRTRREVEEAQRLEAEISSVWEVAQGMFAAVVHAVRAEASERQEAVLDARRKLEESQQQRLEIERLVAVRRLKVEEIVAQRTQLRVDIQASMGRLEKKRRAWELSRKMVRVSRERDVLEQERQQRERADQQAQQSKESARLTWDRAREALAAAGRGVADLRAGLEELERRAAEHRLAHERLQQVQESLPEEQLSGEASTFAERLMPVMGRVLSAMGQLDDAIVQSERTLSQASLARQDYERAWRALEVLNRFPVTSGEAHARAREILAELRSLEGEVAQLKQLQRQWEDTRRHARRQREVRELAAQFGALHQADDVRQALEDAEAAEAAASERVRQARLQADQLQVQARGRESQARQLEPLMERWRGLRERLTQLETRHPVLAGQLTSAERFMEARRLLEQARGVAAAEVVRCQETREGIERQLMSLRTSSPGLSEALLAARDVSGGELLQQRFENLELEDAILAEAALGPLRDAIVVDDPVKAAKRLAQEALRPDELWLVGPRAALPLDDEGQPYAEHVGDAVLLEMNGMVRLTRLPSEPRLGRASRLRRIELLEQARESAEQAYEQARDQLREAELGLLELDRLVPELHLLDRADPQLELTALRAEVLALWAQRESALSTLQESGLELEAMKRRREGLRKLLPESALLNGEPLDALADELAVRLERAKEAETRLKQVAHERRQLESGLDALRVPPLSEGELMAQRNTRDANIRQRDRLQETLTRLRWLSEHSAALEWQDAVQALSQREALRPALEAQLRQAELDGQQAEAQVREAEQSSRKTAEAAAKAGGAVISVEQQLDALRRELGEIAQSLGADGVDEQTGVEVVDAEEGELSRLERLGEQLEQHEREARGELVRSEERLRSSSDRCHDDQWRLGEEERLSQPAQTQWGDLKASASAQGLLAAAFNPRLAGEGLEQLASKELWGRARAKASLLAERVSRARDGVELAATLRLHLDELEHGGVQRVVSASLIAAWLKRWTEARDWLKRRVPPQIAEVDDPLEALSRLREHLMRLQDRLGTQEKSLRGQSGDVARNIEAQVRRARNQVQRLNGDLEGVRFGAIEGMQIKTRPAQRMEAVLRALREGEAQQLLFEPNLPIEEAMDELFRRYGGGRTGGDRVLDYREYLELSVEIKRRGQDGWEQANPTRLSTGEAIGVGAAVMMATLRAWEHDANLLRPKQMAGTMRLLFLDEATRLSQDNLGILFELCERLELQLLIAAPEVARAEGNTTYRLVRALDPSGREEVRVSGRRVIPRAQMAAEKTS